MTEVAEYTNLKSIKQNQTKAECQGLQQPLLPTEWPSAMAKAITVSVGTEKEGFGDGLCQCARHHGTVTPILGPWFLTWEWTRHCLRPAPAAVV